MNGRMDNKQIYALGVGHNTPVFIDLAEQSGYEVVGLYHYNNERTGETDHGYKIIGSFEDLFSAEDLSNKNFMLTMGDNDLRCDLIKKIIDKGGCVPSIIHPSAVISKFAKISPIGVYVSAFSHIQADTEIGDGTIILSGVNISHTNKIGNFCFIAGGATIGAYTIVEDFVFVGQGALTISGKVKYIKERAYIGARALVTKSIDSKNVIAGQPAKVIRVLE